MTDEKEINHAFARSRSNVGLGMTVLRQVSRFVFEDVGGGREPLFELTKEGYLHQSGYGTLSPDRVIVVPNVQIEGKPAVGLSRSNAGLCVTINGE